MKKTLVALAASFAVTTAFAQASTPAAASAPAAQASAHREARVEDRINSLHASLKITPQQEDQWAKFADVMRDNARSMSDLYRQRMSEAATMNALDDMKQYQQITQAHADGTKHLVDAFEPLYSSFSPDQKKLADASFRGNGRPMGGKGAKGHHPGKAAAAAEPASTVKP